MENVTPTNLGQLSKPGTDLESAGSDVFKTPPTCPILPSFGWDIWGQRHMILFFYFLDNWFVGDENNRNLNNLFQKLFSSPSKVPISTGIILRNTI